ncbi:unnamed protein product [Lathyrus sativus]|nr:unnamed protein product [Lathyrus sativus]
MNFLLFALTCATIYVFLRSIIAKISKPNYKLPPGPSPLPIIGNLLELGNKPHKSLAKLAEIHGPLMSLKFGQITTVVISSADMAKHVLLTNDQFLSNRTVPQSVSILDHQHYTLPFLPISPLWKELRKICNTELLSHKTLDASQDVRRKKIQELLNDIDQSSQIGEAIEVGTAAFKTTINLLSNTIFSVDLIQTNGEAGEFKDLVTDITKLVGTPNLADFFPVLKMIDPQGVKRRQTENVKKLFDIFQDLVIQRLKMRESTCVDTNKDMLDSMLNIFKENEFIDNNMIKHLSHDIFVAGTDTTSSTLEWAMTELNHNPEVMVKAKKELEKMIGCGVPLEESNISNLPYLQAIIKETLRLHPPVPLLLPRKAVSNVDICGYTIPKDAQVLVNVWKIGRDPAIWMNPTLFSPERFLGSEIDFKGRNFELVPFGGGRRICPGLVLANRMLMLMLGSLVNSFDWKLEGNMKPENMNMDDKFGITLQMAQPLRVVPVRISK